MRHLNLVVWLGIAAMGSALLSGCGGGDGGQDGEEAGPAQPKKVELAYVEWGDATAATNVVKYLIEHELGYECEIAPVSAAVMWSATAEGDYDGFVAAWLPVTHQDYWDNQKDQVVDLGPNLEGAKIGLVVPSYVTIDSIPELNDHEEQFDGEITGIDPGAGIMRKTEAAIEEYGLDGYKLISSSGAVMAASLANAIDNEAWIAVTGWTPHWIFARYDLKYLDDPKAVYGGAETVNTIVRQGLKQDMPKVYELLDRFKWTVDEIGQVMLWNQDPQADPAETAERWVKAHPERVKDWLPQATDEVTTSTR